MLKEIKYDRRTKDYSYWYNGELLGFASTYHEAEIQLDAYVYELLMHEQN